MDKFVDDNKCTFIIITDYLFQKNDKFEKLTKIVCVILAVISLHVTSYLRSKVFYIFRAKNNTCKSVDSILLQALFIYYRPRVYEYFTNAKRNITIVNINFS